MTVNTTAPETLARPRGRIDRFLDQFSRVTTSGRFIPEIDGLRFVAILLVFLAHVHFYTAIKSGAAYVDPPRLEPGRPADDPLVRLLELGGCGVLLFFVVSGFILALPFAEHGLRSGPRVSLRGYYVRRLTRLEPPYLLSMVLLFALVALVNRRGMGFVPLAQSFAASCVYAQGLVFGTKSPINFVTWSLEVEVQFYVLVPLLTRVFLIRHRELRRGLIVASMVGLVAGQKGLHLDRDPRLALSVLAYGQYFLAGFLLADVYVADWGKSVRHDARWDVVSLVGWPVLIGVIERHGAWDLLIPFLMLGLYVALFRGVWLRRVLTNRVITTIGGMCYTIYLLHVALISAFGRFTTGWTATRHYAAHAFANAAALSVPVLAVCAGYFVLVERPCMRRDWPQALVRWVRGPAPRGPARSPEATRMPGAK